MKQSIRVRPPHSLLFVSDQNGGDCPIPDRSSIRLWASREGLSIGCYSEQDGETDFALSDEASDVLSQKPIYDGVLDTPSRIVIVSTSSLDTLLETAVPTHFTRVRIWTNHPVWPNDILVVLG